MVTGRRMGQTKPGGLLRREAPVVVGKWRKLDVLGCLENDLGCQSWDVTAGEWTWALCATAISANCSEKVPVVGKGQTPSVAALERIRRQRPARSWAYTRTKSASFSTSISGAGAARLGSCSLAPALSTRTTIATWSRRTGTWCAARSAASGSTPRTDGGGWTCCTATSSTATTTGSNC